MVGVKLSWHIVHTVTCGVRLVLKAVKVVKVTVKSLCCGLVPVCEIFHDRFTVFINSPVSYNKLGGLVDVGEGLDVAFVIRR